MLHKNVKCDYDIISKFIVKVPECQGASWKEKGGALEETKERIIFGN